MNDKVPTSKRPRAAAELGRYASFRGTSMTRRFVSALTLLVSCVVVQSCATPPQKTEPSRELSDPVAPASFEAAQLLARRDEARPDTLEWRRNVSNRLGPALSVTHPCDEGIALADIPTVNAVVRLSFQGRATDAFALETSTYAKCFAERLRLLDVGSAPWDGYWFEIRMEGPADSARRTSRVLSFLGEVCVPNNEVAKAVDSQLTITKITPASGSSVNQRDTLSVSLSYSLAAQSDEHYKVMVLFETSTPGKLTGAGPVDFPYPITCGTRGSIKASIPVEYFWSMPNLPNPVRIRLLLVSGADFKFVAQSDVVEFSKQSP
ncbi:MAG: hypothetical protein ABIQ86_06870 [Steroidobacteraceae bacterium]